MKDDMQKKLERVATIPLKELISEPECKRVWEIINGERDSVKRVRQLTDYLATLREKLEAKGMLPEFLAYAIEYKTQHELGKQFGSRPEGNG